MLVKSEKEGGGTKMELGGGRWMGQEGMCNGICSVWWQAGKEWEDFWVKNVPMSYVSESVPACLHGRRWQKLSLSLSSSSQKFGTQGV